MSIILMTQHNFEEIITNHEIIIIDFWAEWCGPCKSFLPVFEQTAAKYPDICFAKVEIDQEPELAQDFQVRSIPQIVLMKQKVIVFSESGLLPASSLENLIEQTIALDLTSIKKQIAEQEKQ